LRGFRFCILTIVALVASAVAAAPTGMLYTSGTVNVNGVAVNRSTAIFEGDIVATNATSAGTVSYNGSSVLVTGNSTISIAKGTVSINSGSAAVQTTQGLMAQIGRITIAPTAQAARFRVVHNGNSVTIAALEQNLNIYDGAKNISLLAGRSITLPFVAAAVSSPAATTQPKEQGERKSAGAAEPQGTTTPAAQGGTTAGGGGVDTGITPGLVAVISATVSSAITTALALGQSPATPIGP
jgi:hypothetical protein